MISLDMSVLKNTISEYSGTYSCTVRNRVDSDQCLLNLDVVLPSDRTDMIAGAIIGTFLALVFIDCTIFCCHKKCRKEKYGKEVHEIKEDVSPPKCCMSTARSYTGSNYSTLRSMSYFRTKDIPRLSITKSQMDFEHAPQSPTLSPAKFTSIYKTDGITVA